MSEYLLLNNTQAEKIRGNLTKFKGLDPIRRQGFIYILNANVLNDPVYKEHHEFLSSLNRMDSNDPFFPKMVVVKEE